MLFERDYGWEHIWDDSGLRGYKRRRFGFLIIRDDDELRPLGEMCTRKNENLVGPDGYFIGYYRWYKYQKWAKHLFTKKGVCRRCGLTMKRQEEMKEEIRYWETPLRITPVQ